MRKYLVVVSLIFSLNIFAERGDIISYELLDERSSQEVLDYAMRSAGSFIDLEENVIIKEILKSYFTSIIKNRDLSFYKLIYETIDFEDQMASGVVIVPKSESHTCTLSFSIYGHGTMFAREEVFSRPVNWNPAGRGSEFLFPMLMAAANTICAVPDYYGMGDGSGFHHHNSAKTNAASSLDLVRAGRNLCDQLGIAYNQNLITYGYSEGGTNAMAVAKMVSDNNWKNEFKISLVVGGSGAYDMSGEAYEFIINNEYYPTRAYIPYLIGGCQDMEGMLYDEEAGETPSDYFEEPYDQLYMDNLLTQNGNMGWVPLPWPQMFKEGIVEEIKLNPDHPFRRCLENNNVYDWANPYTTYLLYCTTDEQVPYTGAIKTKEVQQSYIPSWKFWDRFKIQAIDLTLGGFSSSHSVCSLPSIVVELLLMNDKRKARCTRNEQNERGTLRANTGEVLNSRVIHTLQRISNFELSTSNRIYNSVEGVNLMTGKSYSTNNNKDIVIKEQGLYLFKVKDSGGQEEIFWTFKQNPTFVKTDDYDPILTNPMVDQSKLDLSLLNEEVKYLSITDMEGNLYWKKIVEQDIENFLLKRTEEMKAGKYILTVNTVEGTYPLSLKVEDEIFTDELLVFPNPTKDFLKIRLKDYSKNEMVLVHVYNAQGQLLKSKHVTLDQPIINVDVKGLSTGMYVVKTVFKDEITETTFVKE